MNEQPVSKILFKGDWGRCPNKQFEKKASKGILRKRVNLYRFALLAAFVPILMQKPLYQNQIIPIFYRNTQFYKGAIPCCPGISIVYKGNDKLPMPKSLRNQYQIHPIVIQVYWPSISSKMWMNFLRNIQTSTNIIFQLHI